MSIDKILQLERSKRRILLSALVLIAGVALYRWILSPYSGELAAAYQYRNTLNNTIHKAGALGTTLGAKREKARELADEFNRRQDELFTPNEVQRFLGSLQAIAHKAGCTVQSVSSTDEGRQGRPRQQNEVSGIIGKKTVVTVVGGYGDIIKFLGQIQTYRRKIWIESFRLDTGGGGKLKCQVALTLYCFERAEASLYE